LESGGLLARELIIREGHTVHGESGLASLNVGVIDDDCDEVTSEGAAEREVAILHDVGDDCVKDWRRCRYATGATDAVQD
jgi:hypothetical protein